MSFAPTGQGANISSVLKQMIEQYLLGLQVTSSGGDSPKVNKVFSLPEVEGFGDIIDSAIQDAVQGATATTGDDPTKSEKDIGAGDVLSVAGRTTSNLQNPVSIVSQGLAFLPHAVIVSFVISILPTLINELTKPGGDFDLRFKRRVEEEYNSLEARKYLFDIRIGQKGLILQTVAGLLSTNQTGAASANTLRMIKDGGIDKSFQGQIDYVDHAEGLF